jgi:hypothetical protein
MEHAGSFGLTALGTAGAFTVEVLSRPEGGWSLSVNTAAWCFEFPLIGPAAVGELAQFLRAHASNKRFVELTIGMFNGVAVRVVKDEEFADRFFIRSAGVGSLVEFSLVGQAAREFAEAAAEAAADFGAEAS